MLKLFHFLLNRQNFVWNDLNSPLVEELMAKKIKFLIKILKFIEFFIDENVF
jgi:hypothetical protein